MAVVDSDYEVDGFRCQMIFNVLGARDNELSEYLQAQSAQSLTAFSFCRDEMVIKLTDFFGFESGVAASNRVDAIARAKN